MSMVRADLRRKMRGDVIIKLALADARDPLQHPDSANYVAIAQSTIRYFEALDVIRLTLHEKPYSPIPESTRAMLDLAERELRLVVGWPMQVIEK